MRLFQNLALCLLSLAYFTTVANGACSIEARDEVPLFIKHFGSKTIVLPKTTRNIALESGETIKTHCRAGLSLRSDYNDYINSAQGVSTVELYCDEDNLSFLIAKDGSKKQNTDRRKLFVSCETNAQQLYESEKELPNCQNYSSYAIGIAPTGEHNIVTAGICYDLENLSVKYVNYLGYRPKHTFLEQKSKIADINQLNIQLDKKLSGFNTIFQFMSSQTFNKTYEDMRTKSPILQIYDFDYVSLLQDASLQSELADYGKMFNIIWWRNLRLGNWNNYLRALQRHLQNTTYVVHTGTSGVLAMPSLECNRQEELIVQSEDITLKAPAYIWSYMNSSKEDFVVIASNSPFLTTENISAEKQICKDICDELGWLANSLFGKTHLIPSMGLVNCCRVKDVASKLDNFPIKFQLPGATDNEPSLSEMPTKVPATSTNNNMKNAPSQKEIFGLSLT